MKSEDILNAFSELGEIMAEAASDHPAGAEAVKLSSLMERQFLINRWFTPSNVRLAVGSLAKMISRDNLDKWTGSYNIPDEKNNPRTVALVMAGNIPLVGFHDFLSVLVSGNRVLVKTSSKDPELIREISGILTGLNNGFSNLISFTDGYLKDYDAVIATGSDNSSRYFEYYFGSRPHIFRKNRTSISIITPGTTEDEIRLAAVDVFSYFGLGCRSVSKLFIPEDFDITTLKSLWSSHSGIINHSGWRNNYNYNRAVSKVNNEYVTDGGFFLLRESHSLFSPLSVINYEKYSSNLMVENSIAASGDNIQCIAGAGYIPFGRTQQPELWDYADNIDTLEFLLSVK